MIKFRFDGVNPDGKKVSGFLFSEDEAQARDKLKDNGYAVLNIDHYQEDQDDDAHLSTFEFRGENNDGGFVQGSIKANDPYQAYKKLRGEYALKLQYILPTGLSLKEKNDLKKEGIDPEMVALYDEENKGKKAKTSKAKKASQENVQVLSKKRKKKMVFYKENIEQTIKDVNEMLGNLADRIDHNKLREMQERVDTLSRLRSSNSIEHLDSLVQKLFRELRKLEVEPTLDEAFRQKLAGTMGSLTDRFEKGTKKLELDLSFVDTDKIKKTLIDLRIIENISKTVFYFFAFLFIFCFLGILFVWIRGLITGTPEQLGFFWGSGLYIFVMSFSFLFTALYYPVLFILKKMSPKRKMIYVGASLVIWMIYILEFPVLFFWV